jgi:hypothetical protein
MREREGGPAFGRKWGLQARCSPRDEATGRPPAPQPAPTTHLSTRVRAQEQRIVKLQWRQCKQGTERGRRGGGTRPLFFPPVSEALPTTRLPGEVLPHGRFPLPHGLYWGWRGIPALPTRATAALDAFWRWWRGGGVASGAGSPGTRPVLRRCLPSFCATPPIHPQRQAVLAPHARCPCSVHVGPRPTVACHHCLCSFVLCCSV